MFNIDHVSASYSGASGRAFQHDLCEVSEEAYPLLAGARARKFQTYVSQNARVLEYGVGQGFNLAVLECGEKVGFDVAEFMFAPLAERGIRFTSDLDSLEPKSFDVVICHHVLEHVTDPWATLRTLGGMLAPGGTLLLFVPYERERAFRTFDPKNPNRHLFSWSPQTLGMLATMAGFSVREIGAQVFAYDRFAAVTAARIGGGPALFSVLRRTLQFLRPHYEIRAVLKLS